MKVRYDMEDSALLNHLNAQYGLQMVKLDFIPAGDSAYSYSVQSADGQCFYLKLFDHNNGRQWEGVRRLSSYLPLTWRLYHQEMFRNVTYPIQTLEGKFQTALNQVTLVLFHFIKGRTLADAYPFTNQLIEKIAESTAVLHQIDQAKLTGLGVDTERFDISFVPDLSRCLTYLEEQLEDDHHRKLLKESVLPRETEINNLSMLLQQLHANVSVLEKEAVLCHGDIWGGNIILDAQDRLHLIDWENAVLAPPERDLFGFLGEGFEAFIVRYQSGMGRPIHLNSDLLCFYAYRHHLRNLTNWMKNILYRNTADEQNDNDLDMIRNHCMNRWGNVETSIENAQRVLAGIN